MQIWLKPYLRLRTLATVLALTILSLAVAACGDYTTDAPAIPPPPPANLGKTLNKTNFGPADFLVSGIADFLNSFASFLGQIGVGVLKWFISTAESLNLT